MGARLTHILSPNSAATLPQLQSFALVQVQATPPEVVEDRTHGTNPTPFSASYPSPPQPIDPANDSTDDDYTKTINETFDVSWCLCTHVCTLR